MVTGAFAGPLKGSPSDRHLDPQHWRRFKINYDFRL